MTSAQAFAIDTDYGDRTSTCVHCGREIYWSTSNQLWVDESGTTVCDANESIWRREGKHLSATPEKKGYEVMEHEFLVSGCRYQWAQDHDHAECWRAFMVHQGLPAETTYSEFYADC